MIKKYANFLLITALLLTTNAVLSQVTPKLYSSVDESKMNKWVDSVFNKMSEEERIGQLFMIVADPSSETKNINKLTRLVKNQKIGGILFQKGYPDSQVAVTNKLQKEAKVPLLIALDGEWGLSMRLSETTRFPKNMMLGAISDIKLIEEYGAEVGRQCREMGIHINFAPDVDVNSNSENPVIGIRSFGEDPEDVARRALAYSRGLENEGIIAVAKHFPGHGDTSNDSHLSLPTISHSRERLDKVELYPFKKYINAGFDGVMVAHLNIPALGTNGKASSFSRKVVTELLRDELGFRGLCFTDGLAMKGASVGKDESICVLALQAGNDIVLGPTYPEDEFEAVKQAVKKGKLKMSDLEKRCRRVLCYKYIAGLNNYRPIPEKNLDKRLNTPHAEWLNAKLNEEAITVAKNNTNILPIKQLNKKRIAALSLGSSNDNEFHDMLNKYEEIDCFNLPNKADAKEKRNTYEKLDDYDIIICSIHNTKQIESTDLQNLAAKKELILVFFTTPYHCLEFSNSIEASKSVIIAYEPTEYAEDYAAQVIFGGIEAKGALPVSVPDIFSIGTGFSTEKVRLGFHQPEEVELNANTLSGINTIVREGIDEEAYPGCQVIVAKDGMIVYHKAFGYYDYSKKQAVDEETVYDLASSSKATGTLLAVMKSYDEGMFQLNNKISDYVTGLKKTDKKDIIIKDLLYHQSGLPPTISFYEQAIDPDSYTGQLYSLKKDANHPLRFDARTYVNTSFKYNPSLVSNKRKSGFTAEAARNFYISDDFVKDSIIAGIKNAKMGRQGKYVYSCVNFILLKMMVEKQNKQPMDKFLRDNFFARLGASSTTYNPLHIMDTLRIAPTENDQFVRRQLLRGYVHDEAAAFQGGVSGNAGLFSSANDLAKVMQLYLNNGIYGGERYLSTKTCKLFTGSKCPTSRRGLGFDKPDTKNPTKSPCGLLTPSAVYGHTGYTGTCFWIDPVNNMFFIFLSNRTYPSRMQTKLSSLDIRTRIQDTIYKAME